MTTSVQVTGSRKCCVGPLCSGQWAELQRGGGGALQFPHVFGVYDARSSQCIKSRAKTFSLPSVTDCCSHRQPDVNGIIRCMQLGLNLTGKGRCQCSQDAKMLLRCLKIARAQEECDSTVGV